MHLFWEHGYESTSLAQLRDVMGRISSASFYAAFTSKEALFREAIALYNATHGGCLAPLFDPDTRPEEAIELSLRRSVDMQTDNAHPLGCLVCSSILSCSSEANEIERFVAKIRKGNHAAIRDCVNRAMTLGELGPGRDVAALAAAFNGFLLGISTQARDGVSRATLQTSVSAIMAIWPSRANRNARSVGKRAYAGHALKSGGSQSH